MPQATSRQQAQILVRGAILSLVLAFAIRGPAQIPTRSDPKLLHKTFDAVWNTVNNKFYDPTFGGVDWVAVRKKYEPQIESVSSDAEFRDLLSRMLSEIKISHLSILDLENLDKLLARAEVTRGLTLRDLDNQVVVTRIIEASSAATRGVQPGFIIKAIDGVAVTNARDAERTLATDAANHRLAVVDETNTTREIEVAHKLPPKDRLESIPLLTGARYALIETRILDGKVGYIYFTNFIGPLQKKFRPIFDSMKDTAGIVIDLRGNSGGETEVGLVLAGFFVDKETPISTTQTRKGAGSRYTAKPQANPYLGKVVILLDEGSASESEELAGGLQAAGRVVVIGRTSRGEDMDATFQGLPMKSIALLYPVGLPRTVKGVIEGRGVMPDIEVRLTRAELLEGKDSQLDTAILHIRGLIR
jgi:C-terminal processing protease CtpA/Prc